MPHFYYYIYQILPQNLVIFGTVFILNHQVPSNQILTKVKNPPIRPLENGRTSGLYQHRLCVKHAYFSLAFGLAFFTGACSTIISCKIITNDKSLRLTIFQTLFLPFLLLSRCIFRATPQTLHTKDKSTLGKHYQVVSDCQVNRSR